jgi:hypothetical protein
LLLKRWWLGPAGSSNFHPVRLYDIKLIMPSCPDIKKAIGRPATGQGKPILVRLQPDQLAKLDAWISSHREPQPTRPEAVRRILQDRFES